MFKFGAKVISKLDKMPDIQEKLKDLEKTDVLVGIPESKSAREGTSSITNAQLLYILSHGVREKSMRKEMQPHLDKGVPYSKAHQLYLHEHGSALWRIPPRPVLEPAIRHNKDKIAPFLKKAVQDALSGKDPTPALQKAGMMGQNAARGWFTNANNHWAPNAPSTIKQKGSDHPMIDTGAMRTAITWVIRKK